MANEQPDHPRDELVAKIRKKVPHSARIWNYWMGGKDNYEVDRAAGDAGVEVYPDIATMAVQSRQFLIRAVRYLATEAGIRQFLDIGTGLPTMQNTHEVAQQAAPESK
ncbi:MAG: SAM-dependent methyltransferase, partial [Pseudonocardiaceae bacterium]